MDKTSKYYAIQKAENTADIYIFGDIVEEKWYSEDVSPNCILNQIKDLEVAEINVHINSYGGSVSAGWALYNVLREHKAQINTYADGFVASAACFPYLAGDKRYAGTLSAFFLHQVLGFVWGNADDLRAAANDFDEMTDIGINAFVERAGMQREDVMKLMKQETWLSPETAQNYGIVHNIISENNVAVGQSVKKSVFESLMKITDESKLPPLSSRPGQAAKPSEEPPVKPKEPGTEKTPGAGAINKPENSFFELFRHF